MILRGKSIFGCLALMVFVSAGGVRAQELPKPQKESNSQKPSGDKQSDPLLDDLLNLLDEEKDPRGEQFDKKPQLNNKPQSGENPNEKQTVSLHPLEPIQQAMTLVADALRRGKADEDTIGLQMDVEQQLLGMIEQLEKAQQNQQASSSPQLDSAMSQSAKRNQGEQQQDDGQPEGASVTPSDGDGSQDQGESRGDRDEASAAKVQLARPERLQQEVWGQLPTQLRERMQARMVESFLPAYRKKIEAYYRRLLEP